jgi:hypothetical protein
MKLKIVSISKKIIYYFLYAHTHQQTKTGYHVNTYNAPTLTHSLTHSINTFHLMFIINNFYVCKKVRN